MSSPFSSTSWACNRLRLADPIHAVIDDVSRIDETEFLDEKFTATPDAKRHFIDNPETDIAVRDQALVSLRTRNPDVMFVYFGQIDEFGHGAADSRGSRQ